MTFRGTRKLKTVKHHGSLKDAHETVSGTCWEEERHHRTGRAQERIMRNRIKARYTHV